MHGRELNPAPGDVTCDGRRGLKTIAPALISPPAEAGSSRPLRFK